MTELLPMVFSSSSLLVMPFWALMIFAPVWRWTKRIVSSVWIIVPISLVYALLVAPDALAIFQTVSNPELASIQALLGTPAGATFAWVHFLAFDLFVGRWAYLDSRARNLSPWLVSPILFFILMLAPLGFVLYMIVRSVLTKPMANQTRQPLVSG
ncbi:MAG: ABA4-like family protein [Deinococcota bacterium]